LRRVDRATAEDDFAVGQHVLVETVGVVAHTDRALALEQYARRQRAGDDGEILAGFGLAQERARVAATLAAFLHGLVEIHALLLSAVEVRRQRVAGLLRGLHEGVAQDIGAAMFGDVESAALAVERVGAAFAVLGFAEQRQHVLVRPAFIAEAGPVVVVPGVATDIDLGVDRGTAAQRLAARPQHLAIAAVRLRLGAELPVVDLAAHQRDDACGDGDQQALVDRTGFEQADLVFAAGRQTVGQHAAGRAAADDDVVVHRATPCWGDAPLQLAARTTGLCTHPARFIEPVTGIIVR
jgi:hypothetical protein